jgi:hypothetical protein
MILVMLIIEKIDSSSCLFTSISFLSTYTYTTDILLFVFAVFSEQYLQFLSCLLSVTRDIFLKEHLTSLTPLHFCACLSQTKTWISNVKCHGLIYVQWFEVRDDCSFCWYWWNCWPSLFKLFFIIWHHLLIFFCYLPLTFCR